MYTHPFFEATPPGAAPGPPVKTGARVRHFRGCNKDYSVDCDSDRYSGFIAYAAIMILVYPIGARGLAVQNIQGTPALIRLPPRSTGIPVFYGALLFKSRETLRDSGAMGRELANGFPTVGHLMFLVEAYKRTLRRTAELLPS